jgi:hypothetical protein
MAACFSLQCNAVVRIRTWVTFPGLDMHFVWVWSQLQHASVLRETGSFGYLIEDSAKLLQMPSLLYSAVIWRTRWDAR